MDLVSVVIPAYNRGAVIERSIQSVLNQTYSNIELIIVDDCSTDNTAAVVQSLYSERVKYYKLPHNMGACAARNEGIRQSTGKYIAFQDSDDEWFPNKLEFQIKEMKVNGAEVSFCNFERIKNGHQVGSAFPQNVKTGFLDRSYLLRGSICSTQCLVAEKKCFEQIQFDVNLPRLQDWDVVMELSKKYKIYHVNSTLVRMFVEGDDRISSHPEKGIQAIDYLRTKNKEDLKQNPELVRLWNLYRGGYVLANGQNPSKEYYNALKIKFTWKIFVKYLMCKLHVLGSIHRESNM